MCAVGGRQAEGMAPQRPPALVASPMATLGAGQRDGCRSSGRERKGEGPHCWWVVDDVNKKLEVRNCVAP